MKNKYVVAADRWWLAIVWVLSVALTAQAQSTQAPVIQWQRVVDATSPIDVNGVNLTSPAIVKNSGGGYTVLTGDRRLLYLTSFENFIRDTPIAVVSPKGESTPSLQVSGLAPASDGGVVLGVKDNLEAWSLQKRDANGALVWVSRIAGNNTNNSFYNVTDVAASSDGGFVVFGTNGDRRGISPVAVSAEKFDRNGVQVWYRIIQYSFQRNTFTNQSIATPDGGYLLVGGTSAFPDRNAPRGWTAKLDSQGNIVQSQEYVAFPYALNGAISNPDGSGSFIAVAINNVFIIQPNGDLIPTTTRPTFDSQATIASDGSGQPYYVVLDKVAQNGGEFRLTGFNQQNQEVWTRTLGGSADDSPQALLTISDGYLLTGTTTSTDGDIKGKQGSGSATWIIRLTKNAPPLVLTQPAYNCQTGAITFNTTGGDGSSITYTAPGVSRSSATSKDGTVEQGLRNDPKPITITATQSGYSTSLTFDFKAFCTGTQPPVLIRPIPDFTFTVGQGVNEKVSQYFDHQSIGRTVEFSTSGLPPGITIFKIPSTNEVLLYSVSTPGPPPLIGPTTVGVYTVRVTATNTSLAPPNNSVSTTFKITVVDKPVIDPPTTPPTGGSNTLALIRPTYDCRTGDIAFNTTGGDGSSITYNAPGISRISPTTSTGIIEQGLRNDPKPITITATQSGQTASYTFDFGTFCRVPSTPQPPVLVRPIASQTLTAGRTVPAQSIDIGSAFFDPTVITGTYKFAWSMQINGIPNGLTLNGNDQNLSLASPRLFMVGTPTTPGVYTLTIIARTDALPNQPVTTTFTLTIINASVSNALTMLPPAYDCATGAITFRSSGGNGTPIEYAAPGITDWTTNPSQFVDKDARTANDVKPFTLMARQNGVTVTYNWDLKAACGRARLGVAEAGTALSISVLGNPVTDLLTVEIRGGAGQPLNLRLIDAGGRLVESRTVEQAGAVERQQFGLPSVGPGLLLLRASSGNQTHTVKILKQ